MFSVVNCITTQHNIWLVLVAALVCVSGSWAVLRLFSRGRSVNGAEAVGWQFLAATAAGASIWSTHFIAIIAYHAGTPVTFDPVLTIISLLIAMAGSFCGLMVAGMIRTSWSPAVGGALVGLSIAIMHYTGMLAYVAQGTVDWDMRFLIASIFLAVTITSAAIQIASRDYSAASKIISVGLLTLAIVSLHFTGMTAFKLTPIFIDDSYSNPAALQAMALAIALLSVIIVGAVAASYLIDNQNRVRSVSELEHMALNDVLTGLANRACFNDRLAAQIELVNNGGAKFALVAIDLDRFKEINDIKGHSAGDEALKILAQRMRDANDGTMFIARTGGDEFSIIAPVASRGELREALLRLRAEIIRPFMLDGFHASVGASFGACIFPDDAQERETLINNTDLALYRAKSEIGEKICFFDKKMDDTVRNKRQLAIDLRHALENNQLEVYYQVQTLVSDSSVIGYEALLRWQHPQRGFIPPVEFIPLAEESGLILQLGEWVLRAACSQCSSLGMNIRVAVNLSPVQFLHPNLPGLVADVLTDTGLRAENLELELTESAIIQDKERTLLQLQQIRKLGVTIALDDFGTGYSSLDTLRAFPFDKIKLDRSFMGEIESSKSARAIIRAVLALGRSLEIPVLAEGIETCDQLAILHAEGCESAQGYLFGRPAPFADILSGHKDDPRAQALPSVQKEMSGNKERAMTAAAPPVHCLA
ncbi:bifunctional diguanylate cyclase/phosphodiesterase [Rhizobium phaseoli]|uniref:putative bifunctional diguanylate cyclase/phosphodiesterase n=1 Tax=Rhizobium phaseoli TaxID=396 RepID=UPI000303D5ED|nr:EAL domain-containing protein [Rhizobium phaseoli]KKZ84193.1 diguanylate cyclase [Rhizobium phaseoli Ch24-10]RDJ04736.1 bifunctional diguanylate cyclase/phosphodiesterase [Rhizobium phaseoli]RDJ06989.1 bifunctional diguanylate cyclase/phosphodiesterase [Rhizobium phaseoli]